MNTKDGRKILDNDKTYSLEIDGQYKELYYSHYYGKWRVNAGIFGKDAEEYSEKCKIYTASTTTRIRCLEEFCKSVYR